eukprot:gnl/Chilomastix_caulleri/5688.p1 GENE.gnl/Chilomastix_caulleri/5688~~gnl/Chilomastix_caulleri/5688.p1  ORF type:complete len:77 (-),score=8.26 gnl/Chilomastix_caulleri/5688:234-464(-)
MDKDNNVTLISSSDPGVLCTFIPSLSNPRDVQKRNEDLFRQPFLYWHRTRKTIKGPFRTLLLSFDSEAVSGHIFGI